MKINKVGKSAAMSRKTFAKVKAGIFCALLTTVVWYRPVSAATVEQVRHVDGQYVWALKIEGKIEPGDTDKLLIKLLNYYDINGPVIRTVYLRSEGGDVEEAMKMGTLIRKLRLTTNAPDRHEGEPLDSIMVDDKNNDICASACFLAYAGGVNKSGSFLALHRPYFSKEDASKLSDLEHETAEKQEMHKVEEYLKNLEIDQFFIDKMMSKNSQDAYIVTASDEIDFHLTKYVPSIEEILLAKCSVISSQEVTTLNSMTDSSRSANPDTELLRRLLVEKLVSGDKCEDKVLQGIREKAFEREIAETKNFVREPWKQEADDLIRISLTQNAKMEGAKQKILNASELYPLVGVGLTTYGFENLRTYFLEKKDLPAGKTALQIWRLLADEGNRHAQYMLGEMYFTGKGLPQDYAEAAKWNRMAADQGHHMCQAFLAVAYQMGNGVPQNYIQAYKWYSLAVDYEPPKEGNEDRQGYDGFVELRDQLAKKMTPEQIAEAQKLAREWKPTPPQAAAKP